MRPVKNEVTRWLLKGDAAIRWQVLRDLLGSAKDKVEKERGNVGREGWGARLLGLQEAQVHATVASRSRAVAISVDTESVSNPARAGASSRRRSQLRIRCERNLRHGHDVVGGLVL